MEGIPVLVERKHIKHMYLRICPDGSVHLSAPLAMPEDAIRTFAASRGTWLRRHLDARPPASEPPQYVDGEVFWLWGSAHPLRVLPAGRGCTAALENGELVLRAAPGSTVQQRGEAVKAWYRVQLRAAIGPVRQACEAAVGRRASEVRIRDMRTRWGTCNTARRRIWLSLQLAQRPPECLRYVMIHELVHLLERRHNARFYSFMDQFCPDWREMRLLLNQGHEK